MNDFRTYSAAFQVQQEDLRHYGVMGMKWGVRRYQPYPSNYNGKGVERLQTKHLNANSRNIQRNERAMEISKRKMDKSVKGSDSYKKWEKHFKESKASRDYAKAQINKILSKIDKKKFDVIKKERAGSFQTPGENAAWIASLLGFGPLAAIGVDLFNNVKDNGTMRSYTGYKVKRKKK